MDKQTKGVLFDPLFNNNPIALQVLGICSALAVTTKNELLSVLLGGIFFIGGTPLGKRLMGTLEEVIVDPFDGGEPPGLVAGQDEDGLWRARLPVVVAP